MYIGAQVMTSNGESKLLAIELPEYTGDRARVQVSSNLIFREVDEFYLDKDEIQLILRPRKSLIKEELALLSSVSDWIAGASKMHQIDTPMAVRILIALRIDIFDLIKDGGAINFYDLHPGKVWPS